MYKTEFDQTFIHSTSVSVFVSRLTSLFTPVFVSTFMSMLVSTFTSIVVSNMVLLCFCQDFCQCLHIYVFDAFVTVCFILFFVCVSVYVCALTVGLKPSVCLPRPEMTDRVGCNREDRGRAAKTFLHRNCVKAVLLSFVYCFKC